DDSGRRQDRSEAREDEKRRQRKDEGRSDRDRTEARRGPTVVEWRRPARRRIRRRTCQIPEPTRPESRHAIPVAIMQQCCLIATIWRRRQRRLGMSRRLRSRILFMSVLRFRPRISATFIWLPRVRARVAAISRASRSRKTRWWRPTGGLAPSNKRKRSP